MGLGCVLSLLLSSHVAVLSQRLEVVLLVVVDGLDELLSEEHLRLTGTVELSVHCRVEEVEEVDVHRELLDGLRRRLIDQVFQLDLLIPGHRTEPDLVDHVIVEEVAIQGVLGVGIFALDRLEVRVLLGPRTLIAWLSIRTLILNEPTGLVSHDSVVDVVELVGLGWSFALS